MPIQHERYRHREKYLGRRARYKLKLGYARSRAVGEPIEDGTIGVVVDVFDFDYPYLLKLDDGRFHRVGSWINWELEAVHA